MDLSKALDSIPDDLLIAIMEANGFSEDDRNFLYSYLECVKQFLNINKAQIKFQILLSGTVLGPLLFNIFKKSYPS